MLTCDTLKIMLRILIKLKFNSINWNCFYCGREYVHKWCVRKNYEYNFVVNNYLTSSKSAYFSIKSRKYNQDMTGSYNIACCILSGHRFDSDVLSIRSAISFFCSNTALTDLVFCFILTSSFCILTFVMRCQICYAIEKKSIAWLSVKSRHTIDICVIAKGERRVKFDQAKKFALLSNRNLV